jgi:hypothetical protein
MAEFVRPRAVRSLDQLSATQIEQLRRCGSLYHGSDLPPEALVPRDDDDGEEERLYDCRLWDVTVNGAVTYEAWLYQVDSGSVFRAGTTDVVAEIIQFGLECEDPELELLLGSAMVRAGLLPKSDSEYERYSEVVDSAGS